MISVGMDNFFALVKPISIALGGVATLSGIGWGVWQKLKPVLGQNYRDKELSIDYEKLLSRYRMLEQSSQQVIQHAVRLEAHLQVLGTSVVRLAGTVESMVKLLTANKDNNDPFIILVHEMNASAKAMKIQAEEAISLADKEVVAITNITSPIEPE